MDKKLNKLTATRLRLVLAAVIVLLTLLIALGFYGVQSYLYKFAVEVSHANEDAATSGNDIQKLQNLQQKLADEASIIDRTKKIVADSKSYEYQDQIIADLNTYAARAGVLITSFVFADNNAQASAGASAPADTTAAAIPGLKSTTVAITLESPTKYNQVMNFVHYIEQNLTKMQLASLELTKGAASDEVATSTLEIGVYIK